MDQAPEGEDVQVQLAQSYDEFYGGEPAPLSEFTAALWSDEQTAAQLDALAASSGQWASTGDGAAYVEDFRRGINPDVAD